MHHDPKRKKQNYRTEPCNDVFTCRVCGWPVGPRGAGSHHRNHCPNCLSSVHLDDEPGDRAAQCGGTMEPVAVWVRKGGEWAVIHRCKVCGVLHSNRVAADDNPALLMSLAVKPLAEPPFPLSRPKHWNTTSTYWNLPRASPMRRCSGRPSGWRCPAASWC